LVETPNKACSHGTKTEETELRVSEEDSFDPGVPETSGIKNGERHVFDVVIVRSALSWRFVRCGHVGNKRNAPTG
jgi:hypothetical protein